jgi:hypothetical protein
MSLLRVPDEAVRHQARHGGQHDDLARLGQALVAVGEAAGLAKQGGGALNEPPPGQDAAEAAQCRPQPHRYKTCSALLSGASTKSRPPLP